MRDRAPLARRQLALSLGRLLRLRLGRLRFCSGAQAEAVAFAQSAEASASVPDSIGQAGLSAAVSVSGEPERLWVGADMEYLAILLEVSADDTRYL